MEKLSRPPFYSTDKNKYINEILYANGNEDRSVVSSDCPNWSPYDKPIESKRSGPVYNMHSYPTKIDYKSIIRYILYYTKPGDVVFDGFSGTGSTGLAALSCEKLDEDLEKEFAEKKINVHLGKRKAVITDLSPIATFISSSVAIPVNIKSLEKQAMNLLEETEKEIGWMYKVVNNGTEETIRQIIWSEVYKCHHCGDHIDYWDVGVDFQKKTFHDRFTCPNCKNIVIKTECERVTEEVYDDVLKKPAMRVKRIPKRVYVQVEKNKYYRECIEADYKLIQKIEDMAVPTTIPNVKMMFKDGNWGEMYRSGYHKGITHVHHFYTKRNLIVLGTLWEKAWTAPIEFRNQLLFLISSYNLSNSTLMTRVVFKSNIDDLVVTGYQNGQLYMGSISLEKNILKGIKEQKLKTLLKAIELFNVEKDDLRISTQSITDLDLPDNSIDYIFTDPPFGQDIIYSEMNFILEAWLGVYTDNTNEAIICKAQGKELADYKELMKQSFSEMYRILKPNKHISVVFHNSKKDVWDATLEAMREAGFKIVETSILDKKQGSIKQVKAHNAVSKDIIIGAVKLGNKAQQQDMAVVENKVWDYLAQIIGQSNSSVDEMDKQLLYSLYLSYMIKNHLTIEYDAKDFYKELKSRFSKE
ncbi:DNA methyltransferase [Paenibacillus camerounensis]|uniref:DNA methyltransferase n=1 Tax=Paenibacillus camerounensis TaxID=1243663 RepID=UPI0006933DCD|nr:DNA methyltransferase [Paenibacillus camerounensis]